MNNDEFREAIQKVHAISIYDLAEKLFPGAELSHSCKSPFRDDRNASFSVSKDGKLWNDFGTGEGGNVVHFYMEAFGCNKSDAFKALLEMVQGNTIEASPTVKKVKEVAVKEREHPNLEVPTEEEIWSIASLRNLNYSGLEIAVDRGFLWTATVREQRAFVITDASRKSYMARRMDGLPWEKANDRGRTLKSLTLTGSAGNWPVGCLEAVAYPAIALCEGGPDFLAAFHFAWAAGVSDRVAPVAMNGASIKNIPYEAYMCFTDKRVRIFAHNDPPGQKAGTEWYNRFVRIAQKVDIFMFDGVVKGDCRQASDLNDMTGENLHRGTINRMMEFANA